MSTLTYLPVPEAQYGDYLEVLARAEADDWDSAAEARPMCPLLGGDEFGPAWEDFCEAVRDRDSVAPPATRHWTEVLGEDAAGSQEQAYELLCERADEALLVLRTGIRK